MSVTDLSVGCRFADYFAICGLDFDSGLETDRLSAHYPDNIQTNLFDEHAVSMFHSFVVTRENASRYYGFSLIFYEEVRNKNICSAMHTLQAMYITELSSGQTPPGHRKNSVKESSRSLPRSFKLAPHTGAALTYFDITKDKLYVAKSVALICQYPFVRVAQLSLPRQPGPGLSPESYVYNLLYEVPVPLPGQALRLYVPPSEPHLKPIPVVIRMPNPPEELPLLDYPLRVMFNLLGVECVVQLFSYYNKLMLVAECIVSLLLPFSWAHVYVPILPAPLFHFLDAPVPFVMGSEAALCLVDIDKPDIQLPEELPIFPHRTPFVEEINHVLDKHQIQRPETEPTKLGAVLNGYSYKHNHSFHDVLDWDESRPLNASPPASPTRSPIHPRRIDALQRIVDIVKRTVMPTTKKKIMNDEEQYNEDIRFNIAIRETFLNRFVHMFLMYENFVIMPDQDRESWLSSRESMVNFDKASFLSDQPQRHRPFLSRFLETQMFATLVDNKIMANWGEYDANLQVFEHRIKIVRTNSLKRIKNAKWQVKDCPPELLLGDIGRRLSTEECKSKTKRMLLEKMGTEESDLGLGPEVSITGVEENTMIASLCDLLERMWSHGVQHKMGKSALWMHLLNYQELEQCSNSTQPIDPNYLTPDLSSVGAEVEAQQSAAANRSRDSSRGGSRDSSRDRLSNSSTLERRSSQPTNPLRPLPENLTFDMRNVQAMTDIKTEIGYARAWVRLSLEKKLLSKHLRELLSDTTLLRSQYKRTAFLRCEEEREQFLYHLLTLNAVDYNCFTNTYPTTKLPYRVFIVPSRKASQTTANCWLSISGANGESTPKIPIPRNTNEFVFHHKNLGVLSTLRIGHDNSGLSPRWLLDHIYARNESPHNALSPTTTHLSTSTIQHMIGDCVNAIVKWHYQTKREKDANSLSVLLCGENGLVKCLEQAFLCGFKSARLFGKNLFIWDYFTRVKDEFKMSLCDEGNIQANKGCGVSYNCRQDQEHRAIWRCYCHLMDEINSVGRTLGKDGKFQLFVCLSLREHWLHRMLVPMSMTRVTVEMYEEQSFLRKRGLLTFLKQILEPLDEFDIVLENSLTQGI
ncbi:unnamed protein product [Leptidea sinapis]|uniref:UDENN domain-containing protein n=1 Tax=Leptidea sinapis TaxID=189913 RepID=A0A5E4Q2W1_9NEOP|nr:unnamed protein product [Leptidea sinapis]